MNNTYPLYDPSLDHDSCGIGMIADLTGTKSFQTISDALHVLERMEHRGATGSDPDTGDGAGILIQIPDQFLRSQFGDNLPPLGEYGLGHWMVTKDQDLQTFRTVAQETASRVGLSTIGWRAVPVHNNSIGVTAKNSEPQFVMQIVKVTPSKDLEDALYVARRQIEKLTHAYAISFSSTVLIYKGMLTTFQLRDYFLDLQNSELTSALAIVHSRFSTNVLPRWELAQPFRFIAHNGEINTVRGNRNWMTARESALEIAGSDINVQELSPIVTPNMSDSASFDETVELLVRGGRSLPHAILMMIPEAWEKNAAMDPQRRDFYRFHAGLMEPWDGPASVTFSDGNIVGAVLDRNGLRPARYWITKDKKVIFASEVGVLNIDPSMVESKGRLQPGKMFLVSLDEGRIIDDNEIKSNLSEQQPYGEWLKQQISLDEIDTPFSLNPSHASIVRQQKSFGYSEEDVNLIIRYMAQTAEEPIGSMGSDAALPVLSNIPRSIFDYFTQLFAQVTNPPLDAIREELVTSSRVVLGGEGNLLSESPSHARQIVLPSPVLSMEELSKIRYIGENREFSDFSSVIFDGLFEVSGSHSAGDRLDSAIDAICNKAVSAVRNGANIIILSDRNANSDLAPIPTLLLIAAVHNRLVKEHLRTKAALIIESGDVREVHHIALLLGFGASAVCPYLALETVDDLVKRGEIKPFDSREARYQYGKSLNKGLIKVMSKMGVSTVASYVGSQLFEALGLDQSVLDKYFPGLSSRIGGATTDRLASDVLKMHSSAFTPLTTENVTITNRGEYQWRRDGEIHLFNPKTVQKLQHATRQKRFDIFREYTNLVNEQQSGKVTLRGLLEIAPTRKSIPIHDVEPVSEILKRFSTGAMSYGSISEEAHTTLAIAMNRIGGKSNTGEGGEDENRFDVSDPTQNRRSAIKQVASGRFGVTSRYLVNADDIQIKMAQGAKPGEGGQLPGSKVYPWIAKTRHSTPGVGLISPPPHHDIYSIEDLKQLIFDLKNANDRARIHVKLVSEQGVGTVAAGVAKAHADVVLISGHDGGTGAAPLTSLKHAGTAWELGLSEAHQTLAANGLRNRVVLQVDGQLKTGRDVVIAALLGAEEFGFATAPLVVSGCIMMRVCHLDTCPVGIATQNPVLRERFTGQPEFVETFFEYIAQEVREYLAELGVRTLDEIIGDTSQLKSTPMNDSTNTLDLSPLLAPTPKDQRTCTQKQDHELAGALDWGFISDAVDAAVTKKQLAIQRAVTNVDRAVGTMTGSAITRALGASTLPSNLITLDLEGSAGQSLGAFIPQGLTIRLEGDVNDYAGKGLSGGRIVIKPPATSSFKSEDNVVAGNVIGYGATSGQIFISGLVGERCGVRNSGATIVVEGTGDHACEYMTGGVVVILGQTGRNLAAGMSGGTLYLYDPRNTVYDHLAAGVYEIDTLEIDDDQRLQVLLSDYVSETSSVLATNLLRDWRQSRMSFVKIETSEYQRARDERRNG